MRSEGPDGTFHDNHNPLNTIDIDHEQQGTNCITREPLNGISLLLITWYVWRLEVIDKML